MISLRQTNRKANGFTLVLQDYRYCVTFSPFRSAQLVSRVWLCDPMGCSTPGFPSITNSLNSLKLMSIESVMPSNHLILCRPLLHPRSIFLSIKVFSNELVLHIRWPKYWSFLPKNTQDWSPLEWTGWISLQSKGLSRVFSNTTVQKHLFFGTQLSSQSNSHIHTWLLKKPQLWPDRHLLEK